MELDRNAYCSCGLSSCSMLICPTDRDSGFISNGASTDGLKTQRLYRLIDKSLQCPHPLLKSPALMFGQSHRGTLKDNLLHASPAIASQPALRLRDTFDPVHHLLRPITRIDRLRLLPAVAFPEDRCAPRQLQYSAHHRGHRQRVRRSRYTLSATQSTSVSSTRSTRTYRRLSLP